jgi:hypothetical protein
MKSTDGSNFNSIKTFTMTAAREYLWYSTDFPTKK